MAQLVRPSYAPKMSWGAVLAGCTIALVTYLTLSVLGTAIGAATIDPLREANPVSGLGAGAGIWLALSTLVSIAAGAFVAGRLATVRGGMHGLLSWAVTSLIATWLVAALASSAVGAVSGVVGKGLSLTGQGIAAAAPALGNGVQEELKQQGIALDWGDLRGQLDTVLRQTGKAELNPERLKNQAETVSNDGKATATGVAQTPQAASDALAAWFDRVRAQAKPAIDAADRDALVNLIVARTGKSRAQAEQIADNYAQSYQKAVAQYESLKRTAEQKARQAGDVAARGVSRAAWTTLVLLILGAGIAFGAGRFGRRSDPIVEV
jgi:ribosomal silencing factor RsfS